MRPDLGPKSLVLHPSRNIRPEKGLKGLTIRSACPLLAHLALALSPRRPILGLVDLEKEVLGDLIKARKTHPHRPPPPTPALTLDTHPFSHPCYTYLQPWYGFIASLPSRDKKIAVWLEYWRDCSNTSYRYGTVLLTVRSHTTCHTP